VNTSLGRNYYIWQEVKMGMWQPRSQLHEVGESEGQKAVLECHRASPEQAIVNAMYWSGPEKGSVTSENYFALTVPILG
jgi:hypothetical protein